MDTRGRRHRSSTATSSGPPANSTIAIELRALIEDLREVLPPPTKRPSLGSLQLQCDDLRRIRQLLIDTPNPNAARDAFRHLRGFNALLETLRSVSGFYNPSRLSRDERTEFFELLKATLEVLSEALKEHSGNRRYFTKRVEGGGWAALEQALASTGIGGGASDTARHDSGFHQLFGCLIAFALSEENMAPIFRDLKKVLKPNTPAEQQNGLQEKQLQQSEAGDSPQADSPAQLPPTQPIYSTDSLISDIRSHLKGFLSGNELIQNPEIVPTIFNFWISIARSQSPSLPVPPLSLAVLLALKDIVDMSTFNKARVHGSGILSPILRMLFGETKSTEAESAMLLGLASVLSDLGINNLEDAYYLVRRSSSSAKASRFLLDSIKSSREPPFIQFDLSINGYSSIELRDIGMAFPPHHGYSFMTWIRVDKYDPACHTTIFGAYDATQTCFLLAYLDQKSRRFILQTSTSRSRNSPPSVLFRSATLKEGVWYHITVMHKRPKALGHGSVSLFVNGRFMEGLKCPYPANPPLPNGSTESFASLSSSVHKHAVVQAFLGTPRNLAPRFGRNVSSSCFSLAAFHLFADVLSDDLVAVYQTLGPRYRGNFQDILGSFQTYQASAELNLLNEVLHPGKDAGGDIVNALQHKASHVLPESRILLSFSPFAVLDDNDQNNVDESELIKSLSKEAARNLQHQTRVGGTPVIVNAAVPSINDALTQSRGFAVLLGDPTVVVPQSLDDALFRIGGCSGVCLKLVELATTKDEILYAVKIMFESIEGNWRNSEAAESENAFGILAELLRSKMGFGNTFGNGANQSDFVRLENGEIDSLSLELLRTILRFVGYDEQKPEDSIINNPLAYRLLLVDVDMWRKASFETQEFYWKQFIHFAKGSKHHYYNSRRLSRMRIVKRLLDALKGETFTVDIFATFLATFEALIECSMSTEVQRFLSLFITYALHDSRTPSRRSLRTKRSVMQFRGRQTSSEMPSITNLPRSESPVSETELSRGLPLAEIGIKILELYTRILCNPTNLSYIRRFAQTVTNKWMLHLLAETEPGVIALALRILARLLIVQGSSYVKQFANKTEGFLILKQRLRMWWSNPTIWTICFAILFGRDVAKIDLERDFSLFSLTDSFGNPDSCRVVYPEILPVLTAMLETGLRSILRDQASSFVLVESLVPSEPEARLLKPNSLYTDSALQSGATTPEKAVDNAAVLQTVIQFLSDLHMRSPKFRDFTVTSSYVQELLFVLYPVVVTTDSVSAETELHSRGSALTFEGQDVIIRPPSNSTDLRPPIVRTQTVEVPPSPTPSKALPLRRGASFVLVTSDKEVSHQSPAKFQPAMSCSRTSAISLKAGSSLVEGLLEVVVGIFQDQVFHRKDFAGFGLFLKVPPGFQEHQAYFETYVLLHAMSALSSALQLNQYAQLRETRVLTNLARYAGHMAEALFEGWFLNGAEPLLDFLGSVLEYLHRPDVARVKTVRLCSQAVSTLRTVFLRVTLLRLSELDDPNQSKNAVAFLKKMIYWQTIILYPENAESSLKLVYYMLFTKIISAEKGVRIAAAELCRLLLVQKPDETSYILNYGSKESKVNHKHLHSGFMQLTQLDNESFLQWIDHHRDEIDSFLGNLSKAWEIFVTEENRKTEDTAKIRISKRKEKLKTWQHNEAVLENTWHRHEISTSHWRANVHASERLKHQRAQQDHQDNIGFIISTFHKLCAVLRGPCSLFESSIPRKWILDETEGRNRMRLRILPDSSHREIYQPKREDSLVKGKLRLDTKVKPISSADAVGVTPLESKPPASELQLPGKDEPGNQSNSDLTNEDEFEIVDDPNEGADGFEDKNRKVMRSLQRGDQVLNVFNISRIVGLEAMEGLLIVGKDSLYLLDDFFQRSDGEIVRVWQAPSDERDPYLQMVPGSEDNQKRSRLTVNGEESARHWRWAEVLSISKRRFLFRDVAIEIFFTDGRSYLLTSISPQIRNELYTKLISRAPHVNLPLSSLNIEEAWRLETLRNPDETPQTIGSRFANVFNIGSSNPATRRWMKGEISNFHYLMLINTMAGRTFNDLTQYPVFPWVIADYTSEELDLSNPRTFRDLSKPMGCQIPARESMLRERYKALLEMSATDPSLKPFHYGTHYSSAMIITSYLIRLQPFVESYLLLQGGQFDHADRLFYSIEKAWSSASGADQGPLTDVRELTPEFFYLPEFLKNINKYNFGERQGSRERIDDVLLPPWAKGDPEIFISKQREALESPYVSKNLHRWIDLVFGFKQRGEAAIEATNLFMHESYHGAIDLDNCDDSERRLRAVNMIHSFGQTPYQIFQRPHPQREELSLRYKRLDNSAESLTRLPGWMLDSRERVASLIYQPQQGRLLCSAAFRLNMPPTHEKYMEWGFTDGGVRFYNTESKKLVGLWEHLHHGQISCAAFVDGSTLITAGTDCTLAAWTVTSGKTVDLVPKVWFFGHRTPVTTLATSKTLSAFLSASTDGKVYLWDLNRSEYVRELGDGKLPTLQCAKISNVTGHTMLCCGPKVLLYTLNGRLLLDQNVCDTDSIDDVILSCAFYEGVGNEWLQRELLFTGHRRGVVNVWKVSFDDAGKWKLQLVKRLNHVDNTREDGGNISAGISYICPAASAVYTGDEDGKVYSWECVQKHHSFGI